MQLLGSPLRVPEGRRNSAHLKWRKHSNARTDFPAAALYIPLFFSILPRFPFPQLWRYGATVSTRPFQGRNTGSIPVSATKPKFPNKNAKVPETGYVNRLFPLSLSINKLRRQYAYSH